MDDKLAKTLRETEALLGRSERVLKEAAAALKERRDLYVHYKSSPEDLLPVMQKIQGRDAPDNGSSMTVTGSGATSGSGGGKVGDAGKRFRTLKRTDFV